MKHKHTFCLSNENEITIWSGYSPDMTFAIVKDRAHLKTAKEVVESARKNGWELIFEEK
jgi:hypothetical protein